MRFSNALIPTRKEVPADAEMPSHQLLLRAGAMEQVSAGIYTLMPLAWRSVRKIMEIIRQELDRIGAQELLLPIVQPAELWKKSGRWEQYGPELLRFKDRKQQDYCLSPTHEEVITDLAKKYIRSYRDMPMNLYQIQVKFRDELRPRAGLLRGREFIMKDAYSFDVDLEKARESYDKMFHAYDRIFSRCGLNFRPVEADTGNIGGSHSHEFQVLASTGEDRILHCKACGYTANEEKAELPSSSHELHPNTQVPPVEVVLTPQCRTVGEVTKFLDISPTQLVKTLILIADAKPLAALVRGDHELNLIKLKTLLNANVLGLASDAQVREITGAPVGFAGPVGLDLPIYVDQSLVHIHDAVTGANQKDKHLLHVEMGRDFKPTAIGDLRLAQSGDPCPHCGQPLEDFRGIEVGHIFILGTKYSKPMGATYLDPQGKSQSMVMGCYGIGVTRVLAAAIEQHHDEYGMAWPLSIAPFQVIVLPLQMQKAEVAQTGQEIYQKLLELGIEVLFDDRNLRAGAKFKDAELIGIPYQVVIGAKNLKKGLIEVKHRKSGQVDTVEIDKAPQYIASLIRESLEKELP